MNDESVIPDDGNMQQFQNSDTGNGKTFCTAKFNLKQGM